MNVSNFYQNIIKKADSLKRLIARMQMSCPPDSSDIKELYLLANSILDKLNNLSTGQLSDNQTFQADIDRIASICDELLLTPRVIAPINFVYIKHHYLKLFDKANRRKDIVDTRSGNESYVRSLVKYPQEHSGPENIRKGVMDQRQKEIMALFDNNPGEYMQFNEINNNYIGKYSPRTLRNDLFALVKAGYIEQNGFGKGSKYRKVKNN